MIRRRHASGSPRVVVDEEQDPPETVEPAQIELVVEDRPSEKRHHRLGQRTRPFAQARALTAGEDCDIRQLNHRVAIDLGR